MIKTTEFIAQGTTCNACSEIIKRQAKKIDGVTDVSFDFTKEEGSVTFDSKKTDIDKILYKIEEKGYNCFLIDKQKNNSNDKIIGWSMAIIGIIIAGYFILNYIEGIKIPQITQNMGIGLVFIVGLLTGFHCISMCGGFVISYTAKDAKEKKKSYKSHFLYGAGKTVSYTIIGALFGLLGSIIAFTPKIRGIAGILAGVFLIIFGLNMLNAVPGLRKFRIKTPKSLNRFIGKNQNSSPLVIGLLNGLMIACGPLQAIYIMAAGTGSMIEGAKVLFIFGLGTLPALLGFGFIASVLSNKATQKILKASGAIVIVLGLIMVNRGLALTGTGFDTKSILTSVSAGNEITGNSIIELKNGYQEIRMDVTRSGWVPDKFVLKKDVPVKWIINGKEITGCNNAIQVPKFNLEFDIKKGEQIIEFTPTKEGVIPWSCWMGMIPGTFVVKEDIDLNDKVAIQNEIEKVPAKSSSVGTCGGGCGCGA